MGSTSIVQAPRIQTISPPTAPVYQPSPRMNQITLDICIQHITSPKPNYIGLYLHSISYDIDAYLIGSIAKTSYCLDVPLDNWKRILEETLQANNLTPQMIKNIQTLNNPPKEIYTYLFNLNLNVYNRIGQILDPFFPPLWDKLHKK
ncbi:MAG: hypothetical protein A2912_03675 [Candidatus Buchananbacteria bacterium RIFCSPLOWO2_01_FULL_40_23b]|uniref:Uncharacterized protein n=1 Tax=Candidatus Buchananbacteria bacterium RIFCSPLOWO2_01_FULL_40_23b TaxID=1797544 RepID=A0A1G1YMM8_9BACT|nr:MAG: hypothetical protein A2912_03675 [Candidatus Buchananbacteria bacterium RIFCSPLOWO2_01_FULL_40_23b]